MVPEMPRKRDNMQGATGRVGEKPERTVLSGYTRKPRSWGACPLSRLPGDILERASSVGVVAEEDSRAATYFQIDHSVVSRAVQEIYEGQVEVMSTPEAIKKYGWFRDYWWRLVRRDADEYTALADSLWDQGYFIRILEDQKVTVPIQSCLFVSTDNLNQNVHNVIIAEPGSDAHIITGCAVHPSVHGGLHVGVSEFYVKEDARLKFTMIHGWTGGFVSRPRSAVEIGENGVFVSNYMIFEPVKSLQMYPAAYCRGENSRVVFNNIIYGSGRSRIDVGAKVVLQNEGTSGEVITRAVATEEAEIYARGFLLGEHGGSRAHLECRGLLLSDRAVVYSVPELRAEVQGAELSHEAAVGKIAEEQIQYLMARGFSEREAASLIIRGFMDVSIFGLPRELEESIRRIVEATAEKAL